MGWGSVGNRGIRCSRCVSYWGGGSGCGKRTALGRSRAKTAGYASFGMVYRYGVTDDILNGMLLTCSRSRRIILVY